MQLDEQPSPAPAYGLTRDMRDCLLVIQELSAANNGVPPSYREIQAELGVASISRVFELVAALEQRGWLARRLAAGRSLRVLRSLPMPQEYALDLTVAGRTAACRAVGS